MDYLCPICRQTECAHWIGWANAAVDGAPIAAREGKTADPPTVQATDSCLFAVGGIRVYRRLLSTRGEGRGVRGEKKKKKPPFEGGQAASA